MADPRRNREVKVSKQPASVAYFVHNLADAAVLRRARALHESGVGVTLIGFRRNASTVKLDFAEVLDLGETKDGRLIHRIAAVAKAMIKFRPIRAAAAGADVIMARNLEMLVLAARTARGRRLVYECLDIHRTLLQTGILAKLVQAIERLLLARVNLIITSSPRFATDYFRLRHDLDLPIYLAENKVPAQFAPTLALRDVRKSNDNGPPWVIGWFGMLRCRRSLTMLAEIASASKGRVEVLIAGIPSDAEFDNFAELVDSLSGLRYVGPYTGDDLASLYRQVHFAWAIDYFEEGLNSSWLLPNRLYESLAFESVPIALASVETGHWLAANAVGVTIDDPVSQLGLMLPDLAPAEFNRLREAVKNLPAGALIASQEDNHALTSAVIGNS